MDKNIIRHIFYYKHYYLGFFNEQTKEVQKKFNWTLQLISELERVPVKYFKHIEGSEGLYEIRVEVGSNIFRVFCFFDKGQLVVLVNGCLVLIRVYTLKRVNNEKNNQNN